MKKVLTTLALATTLSLGLNAQTPANNCAGTAGSELTVGSSCNPITWNSANGSDYWNAAAGCNAADLDDAWGWFNATSTSTTIVYTPTFRDAILTLFEGGCANNMASVACSDVGLGGDPETIVYNTTPGVNYRVRIQRYNSNGNMTGTICVYNSPSPPSNDDCSSATNLSVSVDDTCTTSVTGTTVSATQSIPAITCGFTGNANDDVWYSFVATSTDHDITVTPGTLNDAVIDLRSGACNGTNIDCSDDTVGSASEVINATGLTIGTTYYVRVYSYGGAGDEGTFDICITTPSYSMLWHLLLQTLPGQLYISTVSFLGTLEDTSNTSTFTGGYEDYTGLTPISQTS